MTAYAILVKNEAVADLTDAFEYYQNQRIGLGVEFLNEFEKYIDMICHNPKQFKRYSNYRIAVMNRFPYKITFEVEGDKVFVFAVYHDKRNPEKLKDR